MPESLSPYFAFVLGAIDDAGRAVAVALAEAGATVSVTTATKAREEEFYANSILNETWAMGRAGAVFAVDRDDLEEIRAAIGLKDASVLIAMPSVSNERWPSELAEDSGARLVVVKPVAAGFALWIPAEGQTLEATLTSVGESVVQILQSARG